MKPPACTIAALSLLAAGCGAAAGEGAASDAGVACGGPTHDPDAKGTLFGAFDLRFYWIADENESPGGPLEELCDTEEEPLALVSAAFADRCRLEGSCRLDDGRLLHASRACSCEGGLCFRQLDPRKYPWSYGSAQRPLVPFRSVAVDPEMVPHGATLYVPELSGVGLPDGSRHDGCVRADDVGGGIRGLELDFFVGREREWRKLRRRVPARVTAYVDSPRCAAAM